MPKVTGITVKFGGKLQAAAPLGVYDGKKTLTIAAGVVYQKGAKLVMFGAIGHAVYQVDGTQPGAGFVMGAAAKVAKVPPKAPANVPFKHQMKASAVGANSLTLVFT